MGSRTIRERAQDEIMRAIMARLLVNLEEVSREAPRGFDVSGDYPNPDVYKAQARRVMRLFGYTDWPGL